MYRLLRRQTSDGNDRRCLSPLFDANCVMNIGLFRPSASAPIDLRRKESRHV